MIKIEKDVIEGYVFRLYVFSGVYANVIDSVRNCGEKGFNPIMDLEKEKDELIKILVDRFESPKYLFKNFKYVDEEFGKWVPSCAYWIGRFSASEERKRELIEYLEAIQTRKCSVCDTLHYKTNFCPQ